MPAIAIDSETNGPYLKLGCEPFLFTACDEDTNRFSWKFEIDPFTRKVRYDPKTINSMIAKLKQYDQWIFHNALFDLTALDIVSPKFKRLYESVELHDTMLMAHAHNSRGIKALKPLAYYFINFPEDDEKSLLSSVISCRRIAAKIGWAIADSTHPSLRPLKKDKTHCDYWLPETLHEHHPELFPIAKHDPSVCLTYALGDVERTLGLYWFFLQELQERGDYESYLKNTACLLPTKRIQDRGFGLKKSEFPETLRQMRNKRTSVSRSLKVLSDSKELNPRSAPELSNILYEHFDFPVPKFTKTGKPSTDKDCIEALLESKNTTIKQDEFLRQLLTFKKLDSIERYLNSYDLYELDNKLFPSLNIVGTVTLRYSCKNPNTQNIAKKEPKGFEHLGVPISLRQMFGPSPGKVWVCIDYSQLQLRIFAYACQDYTLIDAFSRGDDIHDTVARIVFSTDNPRPEERTAAKNINFGIIFGAGKSRIERMTRIPGSFDLFKKRFPLVDQYLSLQETMALRKGYCRTFGGYPVQVPKSHAYKACNYVIQGTEGELVKAALVNCDQAYEDKAVNFYPIMQIHDELIFESDSSDLSLDSIKNNYQPQLSLLETLMKRSSEGLGFPTEVDTKITESNWALAQ